MEANKQYVFVETDFSRDYRESLKKELGWPTFPMVVKVSDDKEEFVGGYDELKTLTHPSAAPD
jgi:glutaredoxin-related protein